jgi:hypothetical protein
MNENLGLAVRGIQHGSTNPVEWWTDTIARLSAELQLVLGEAFTQDDNPTIDVDAPSFSIWLWSMSRCCPVLAPSWSGVMAGGLLDGDEFAVTVDIFLFDSESRSRLQTTDGRSFIQFTFDAKGGEWKAKGWVRDEWGEWETIAYPDSDQVRPS